MTVKISTADLAKIIIRYMGGSPKSVYSYAELNCVIGHRQGVTPEEIDRAITEMCISKRAREQMGAGDNGSEFGQKLTTKGRRVAAKLRSSS